MVDSWPLPEVARKIERCGATGAVFTSQSAGLINFIASPVWGPLRSQRRDASVDAGPDAPPDGFSGACRARQGGCRDRDPARRGLARMAHAQAPDRYGEGPNARLSCWSGRISIPGISVPPTMASPTPCCCPSPGCCARDRRPRGRSSSPGGPAIHRGATPALPGSRTRIGLTSTGMRSLISTRMCSAAAMRLNIAWSLLQNSKEWRPATSLRRRESRA